MFKSYPLKRETAQVKLIAKKMLILLVLWDEVTQIPTREPLDNSAGGIIGVYR